ncbi:unnamed protein product, partial [Eruca vesicaria subsp. sativa]|nr:unnamed protein product [Eruca vesicaria subsp. sativa]
MGIYGRLAPAPMTESKGKGLAVQLPQDKFDSQPLLTSKTHAEKYGASHLNVESDGNVRGRRWSEEPYARKDNVTHKSNAANRTRQGSEYRSQRDMKRTEERRANRGSLTGVRRRGTCPLLPYALEAREQRASKAGHRVLLHTGDDTPYEQSSTSNNNLQALSSSHREDTHQPEERRSGEERNTKRLASTIVSPMVHVSQEENVTFRDKSAARSLTFPSKGQQEIEKDQMIGALRDMEELDTNKDMQGQEVQDDDLFDEELLELGGKTYASKENKSSTSAATSGRTKHTSIGSTQGSQPKKYESLHRGSPRMRPIISSSHKAQGENDKEKRSRR